MSGLMADWLTPTSLFLLLNVMIGTIFLISRLSSPPPRRPADVDGGHHQFGHSHGDFNSAPPLQRAPSLLDRVKSINFSTYKFQFPNYQDTVGDGHYDHHHLQPDNLAPHPLERAPSILERVKSINFSLYKYAPQTPETEQQEYSTSYSNPQPLSRAPSLLERVKSIDFTSFYRSDSINKASSRAETTLSTDQETDDDSDTDMGTPVHSQVKRSKSESKVKQRKLPEKMKKSASENERRKEEEEEEEEVERRRRATTKIEKTTSFGDDGVDAKADDFINKFKHQLKLQRLDSLLRYRDMLRSK